MVNVASNANSSSSAVRSSSSINNSSLTVANPSSSVVEPSKQVITIKSTIKKYLESELSTSFVFLALVSRRNIAGRLSNRAVIYRELISRHKASHFQGAQYTPFELKYAQQLALYECTKINTAYQNNIKVQFGNRLGVLLNKLFKREEKLHSLHQSMKAKDSTEKVMKDARRKENTEFKAERKFETWGDVVDLGNKVFKTQGPNKSLQFQGTIETDGVGVSVLKQNVATGRKQPKMKTKEKRTDIEVDYIEDVQPSELKKDEDKYVLMDPGRRDLLFCMKETSTKKQPQVLTYAKTTKNKLAKTF
ncbi:unnamed protein product [Rhizopus stolonifer]